MDENVKPKQDQPEISRSPAPISKALENPSPAQMATGQEALVTDNKIEDQIHTRMTGFERSMVRLTRYGLAVTILTAFVFAGQLYEMISGGTQTDKLVSYAKAQADASSDQADAAQQFSDTAEDINGGMAEAVDQLTEAANNSKSGIKATQEAMRLDQRAWIGTDGIISNPTSPEVDKTWDVIVSWKNTGKTPAKNIIMWNAEHVLKNPPNVNVDCAEAISHKATTTLLPPNASYKAILHVGDGAKVPSTWEKDIDDAGALYIDGCVIYDDVFQRKHWMTYCGVFNRKITAFDLCKRYNDTGDGEPPR